ncbi:MAG: hypothetical protein QM778_04950 [Myxococcales bacterium]
MTRTALPLMLVALLFACSGQNTDSNRGPERGQPDDGGDDERADDPGDQGAGDDKALRVRVQDQDKMTIEVITLACTGDCADIEAVAKGGNAPYTFLWEDGSTSAKRHVCLDASAKLSVSATDTAIEGIELGRPAETASTEVAAEVLRCGGPAAELCLSNPSFEGVPGVNTSAGAVAPGTPGASAGVTFDAAAWQECSFSPDIWDEHQSWSGSQGAPAASDGATYLVVYNVLGNRESVGAKLCSPLMPGKSYSFQFDLAFRTQGAFFGASAGAAEIWVGGQACGQDQLVATSAVATSDWQTSCVTFTAKEAFDHIRFAAAPGGGIAGVFVDNIQPVEGCP